MNSNSINDNGCSVCVKGEENYAKFTMMRKNYIQYDYRHTDGELFSCVAKSLDACRAKRDEWLKRKA